MDAMKDTADELPEIAVPHTSDTSCNILPDSPGDSIEEGDVSLADAMYREAQAKPPAPIYEQRAPTPHLECDETERQKMEQVLELRKMALHFRKMSRRVRDSADVESFEFLAVEYNLAAEEREKEETAKLFGLQKTHGL
jgi:hypothetical protein